MLTPGDVIPLVIEKPAAGGAMIARHEGRIVLVSGAIPGERVRARLVRVAKGVAHAETVAIDEPSPDRRVASGDPLCGGCLYSHIAYPRQLEIKSQVIADAFTRIGRLELPAPVTVAGSPEDGYRMRARLHVRGSRVGFFREGTHDLCDARATRQLLPATLDTIERLMAAIRSIGADAVREIELSENVDASERVVHLETSEPLDPRLVDKLVSVDGLTPGPYVTDTITIGDASLRLRRHVLAFFQGNRYLLRDLVAHVTDRVPIGASLLDLYAGVGLFATAAARVRGAATVAVEGDPIAFDDLRANAGLGRRTGDSGSRRCRGDRRAGGRRRDRRSATNRDVARGALECVRGETRAPHLRVVRRRHPRARRAQDRRRRLRDRACRRVRSLSEHAARGDGGSVCEILGAEDFRI